MKLKKIMLITFLLLTVLTITSVSAADNLTDEGILQENPSKEIKLEDANDDIVSSSEQNIIGEKDNGTFTALQNKIKNATSGATITLENDYVYDEGFDTLGIKIDKDVIINGNGHSINALSKSSIFRGDNFQLNSHNEISLLIQDVKFLNGKSKFGGGAIYSSSNFNLTVKNCVFDNNTANSGGGAITWYAGNAIVENCIFTNNDAREDGGAILAARDGQSNLTVVNCIFNNNRAGQLGGAIYVACYYDLTEQIVHVYDGSFPAPNPKFHNILIKDSNFTNNHANEGGAIYAKPYPSDSTKNANVIGCIFKDNKATKYDDVIGVNAVNCVLQPKPKTVESSSSSSSQSSYSSSSSSSSSTSKLTPKLTAKKATFKVKVKTKKYTAILKTNKNKAMKKIKLYLKVKGKTYTAKTNNKGKAIFKIKNLKKKGTYKATVTFKGNSNYNKVTKTVKIKVK